MKWFKIDALIGDDLNFRSKSVLYINPDLIGDTVYAVYERAMPSYTCKVEYNKSWLWLTDENFNLLLIYFKAKQRDDKIDEILND
jgi:hypothetical protein